MDLGESYWIDANAAQALAEWKALFAEQVVVNAKELAKKDKSPGVITLDHYRHAARLALQVLATSVEDTDTINGRQEAA